MATQGDKKYINTTIDPDLYTALKVLAAQRGVRLNYLLEEAIQDVLKKYQAQEEKP